MPERSAHQCEQLNARLWNAAQPQDLDIGNRNAVQSNKRERRRTGILPPDGVNKSYRVNIRPTGWGNKDKFWRGRIQTEADAQMVADIVYHYTGKDPVHNPHAVQFPPFRNPNLQSLTTREKCLQYVISIANGHENAEKRQEFLESVKELVNILFTSQEGLQETREELAGPRRNMAMVHEPLDLHKDADDTTAMDDDNDSSEHAGADQTAVQSQGVADESMDSYIEADTDCADWLAMLKNDVYTPGFVVCAAEDNWTGPWNVKSAEDPTQFKGLFLKLDGDEDHFWKQTTPLLWNEFVPTN